MCGRPRDATEDDSGWTHNGKGRAKGKGGAVMGDNKTAPLGIVGKGRFKREKSPEAPNGDAESDDSQSLDFALDRRSRKPTAQELHMQKRFPDRVPVLIKQARSVGLPAIDQKLLVLKSMSCAELRQNLPLCLSIQQDSTDCTKWTRLCLFIGDEPLKDNVLMSEIYDQYIAEHDSGLQILVRATTADTSAIEAESTRSTPRLSDCTLGSPASMSSDEAENKDLIA
jgi:hypothetical protein